MLEAVYKETDGVPFQFEFKKFACDLDDTPVEYQWQDKWEEGWENKYLRNEDGTILLKNQYVSEDLYFGRIAKRLGYELWASIFSTCYHFTGEV